MKPVIGISGCNKVLEGEPAHAVKARYVDGIAVYAGAIPLIVPALGRPEDAPAIVERLDAIMLTGASSNVESLHYGAVAGRGPHDPGRDRTTLALIRAARDRGIPVIGVCRGFQEINVALGGTLRDQRDGGDQSVIHHAPGDPSLNDMFDHYHEVDVAPGSILENITQCRRLRVNSVHFQMIDRLAEGLRVEATADDGVIEAVASRDGQSVYAVQWHPEWHPESRPHDMAFWRHVGEMARARVSLAQA